ARDLPRHGGRGHDHGRGGRAGHRAARPVGDVPRRRDPRVPQRHRPAGDVRARRPRAVRGGVVSGRWMSLVVVVIALAGYHVAQRSMPDGLPPAPLFTLVYGVDAALMVVVTVVDPGSGSGALRASASHWAPWLLVAAVCGIELG